MKAIPSWTIAAAAASPVLLVGGFLAAAALQPAAYNPLRDTISQLAGQQATDWWLMNAALDGLGLCLVLAAIGLHPAGGGGRALLAGCGVATILVTVFRQPLHGYSLGHELAVIAAAATCCSWPVFATRRAHRSRSLRPPSSFAAAGVSLAFVTWYALESHGALLGLAERCAATVPTLWVLVVVVTTRHALTTPVAVAGPLGDGGAP